MEEDDEDGGRIPSELHQRQQPRIRKDFIVCYPELGVTVTFPQSQHQKAPYSQQQAESGLLLFAPTLSCSLNSTGLYGGSEDPGMGLKLKQGQSRILVAMPYIPRINKVG